MYSFLLPRLNVKITKKMLLNSWTTWLFFNFSLKIHWDKKKTVERMAQFYLLLIYYYYIPQWVYATARNVTWKTHWANFSQLNSILIVLTKYDQELIMFSLSHRIIFKIFLLEFKVRKRNSEYFTRNLAHFWPN